MSRGLPFSVGLHILTLVLVFVFGNQVQRRQFEPPRTIRVKTVQLPQTRPQEQPEVIPERQPAPPEPEIIERAPKEVPDPVLPEPEPKQDPEPEPPKPEPKPIEPAPQETPPDDANNDPAPAAPVVTGPSVASTDVDFPFAWYLSRVQGQIARSWKPKKAGFRDNTVVSCSVHFVIARSGGVSQVTLTRSSGIGVFDREALRVIQTARFPRLPPRYTHSSLGVTIVFNLESDL